MQIVFYILLCVLGACFGSFLCCQARRLHLKSKTHKSLGQRSVCLHCKKPLKWYDNIPIISWIVLKGKCRNCHKKIGAAEFVSEIAVAAAFLVFAIGTNIQFESATLLTWISFVAILIFILIASFLAIYDGLYGELPTAWLFIAIIYACLFATYTICQNLDQAGGQILNIFLSVLILGGVYLALYLISKGKWVGDGDWMLAASIALILGAPWLSLITLFLTNLLALLFSLPNLKKTHKIHLGPFMVTAFIVTISFAIFFNSLINMVQ